MRVGRGEGEDCCAWSCGDCAESSGAPCNKKLFLFVSPQSIVKDSEESIGKGIAAGPEAPILAVAATYQDMVSDQGRAHKRAFYKEIVTERLEGSM